ncbi:MAG: hypothetical protein GEV07_01120 [Streptosporangiales bacterium]|nr:hypothetical protein [Streptosporangiales bacterium]
MRPARSTRGVVAVASIAVLSVLATAMLMLGHGASHLHTADAAGPATTDRSHTAAPGGGPQLHHSDHPSPERSDCGHPAPYRLDCPQVAAVVSAAGPWWCGGPAAGDVVSVPATAGEPRPPDGVRALQVIQV